METGEGVLEIPDGEENTDELPDGEDKRGGETGALGGQDEHAEDADVLEEDIGGEMEDHDGDSDTDQRDGDGCAGDTDTPVVTNV